MLGFPDSRLLLEAERVELESVPEAFIDRAYGADGRLVPRSVPGAVLTDPDEVAARAVRLAVDGAVTAIDGSVINVRARSLCVHGDSAGAVDLATAARTALDGAGVGVFAFT